MKNRKRIILLLLPLLAMISCYSTLDLERLSNSSSNSNQNSVLNDSIYSLINSEDCDTIITMRRTACYGTCPMFTLALLSNGKVYYNGKRFVNVFGIRDTIFNKNNLSKLMTDIEKSGFYDLRGVYNLQNCSGYPDGSTILINIKNNKNRKRVSFNTGCIGYSKERVIMFSLAGKIEELSGIKKWIF